MMLLLVGVSNKIEQQAKNKTVHAPLCIPSILTRDLILVGSVRADLPIYSENQSEILHLQNLLTNPR